MAMKLAGTKVGGELWWTTGIDSDALANYNAGTHFQRSIDRNGRSIQLQGFRLHDPRYAILEGSDSTDADTAALSY